MTVLMPICFDCKHFSERTVEPTGLTTRYTCAAYPNGIPDKWMSVKHSMVMRDQQGKSVFTPKG